jgi:hypothetical protein
VLTAPGLSVDLDSVVYLGHAGTIQLSAEGAELSNPVAISGFDQLVIAADLALPGGGLFLTTGAGRYLARNSSAFISRSRGQTGESTLSRFASQAAGTAVATRDASVLTFDLKPAEDIETLEVDLVFASEQDPPSDPLFADIAATIADVGGNRDERDVVTGLAGTPKGWTWQQIGGKNYLLEDTSNPQTRILLVDPLGKSSRSNQIERLGFSEREPISLRKFLARYSRSAGPPLSLAEASDQALLDPQADLGLSNSSLNPLLTGITTNLATLTAN